MQQIYLTIVLAPLIAAILAGLFGRRIGRTAAHTVTIGGVELPPPTNVLISPWALHHSPSIWPDPEVEIMTLMRA